MSEEEPRPTVVEHRESAWLSIARIVGMAGIAALGAALAWHGHWLTALFVASMISTCLPDKESRS